MARVLRFSRRQNTSKTLGELFIVSPLLSCLLFIGIYFVRDVQVSVPAAQPGSGFFVAFVSAFRAVTLA